MAQSPAAYFELSRQALRTTQVGLGEMLGVARRTAQRWAQKGVPGHVLPDLVRLVHPHHPALAAEMAATMGATLESLGIVKPAPPPAPALAPAPAPSPPPPPPPPPDRVADAVVCAAAEALDLVPQDARPGVYAAFACAKELGLDVAFVERVLGAKLRATQAPAADQATTANRKSARV